MLGVTRVCQAYEAKVRKRRAHKPSAYLEYLDLKGAKPNSWQC
jgi:hypothetical protein